MSARSRAREPSAVFAVLPRAGLGNKLFIWARAFAFARAHNLESYTFGWNNFSGGPISRSERRNVLYGLYIRGEGFRKFGRLARYIGNRTIYEPEYDAVPNVRTNYVFHKIPHYRDYFGYFHHHRLGVIAEFCKLPRQSISKLVSRQPNPVVALHIRRGDFRELTPNNSIALAGLVRTPLEYFRQIVFELRRCAEAVLPVTVFSDGSDEELIGILEMENVHRASDMADVGHLALMARSKVIVASAGSTFSLWGGFLSDAALILHPYHIHAPIRPSQLHDTLYEGPAKGKWEDWHPQLIRSIQSMKDFATRT